MRWRQQSPLRDERGGATVMFILLLPTFVLVFALFLSLYEMRLARERVKNAAESAALGVGYVLLSEGTSASPELGTRMAELNLPGYNVDVDVSRKGGGPRNAKTDFRWYAHARTTVAIDWRPSLPFFVPFLSRRLEARAQAWVKEQFHQDFDGMYNGMPTPTEWDLSNLGGTLWNVGTTAIQMGWAMAYSMLKMINPNPVKWVRYRDHSLSWGPLGQCSFQMNPPALGPPSGIFLFKHYLDGREKLLGRVDGNKIAYDPNTAQLLINDPGICRDGSKGIVEFQQSLRDAAKMLPDKLRAAGEVGKAIADGLNGIGGALQQIWDAAQKWFHDTFGGGSENNLAADAARGLEWIGGMIGKSGQDALDILGKEWDNMVKLVDDFANSSVPEDFVFVIRHDLPFIVPPDEDPTDREHQFEKVPYYAPMLDHNVYSCNAIESAASDVARERNPENPHLTYFGFDTGIQQGDNSLLGKIVSATATKGLGKDDCRDNDLPSFDEAAQILLAILPIPPVAKISKVVKGLKIPTPTRLVADGRSPLANILGKNWEQGLKNDARGLPSMWPSYGPLEWLNHGWDKFIKTHTFPDGKIGAKGFDPSMIAKDIDIPNTGSLGSIGSMPKDLVALANHKIDPPEIVLPGSHGAAPTIPHVNPPTDLTAKVSTLTTGQTPDVVGKLDVPAAPNVSAGLDTPKPPDLSLRNIDSPKVPDVTVKGPDPSSVPEISAKGIDPSPSGQGFAKSVSLPEITPITTNPSHIPTDGLAKGIKPPEITPPHMGSELSGNSIGNSIKSPEINAPHMAGSNVPGNSIGNSIKSPEIKAPHMAGSELPGNSIGNTIKSPEINLPNTGSSNGASQLASNIKSPEIRLPNLGESQLPNHPLGSGIKSPEITLGGVTPSRTPIDIPPQLTGEGAIGIKQAFPAQMPSKVPFPEASGWKNVFSADGIRGGFKLPEKFGGMEGGFQLPEKFGMEGKMVDPIVTGSKVTVPHPTTGKMVEATVGKMRFDPVERVTDVEMIFGKGTQDALHVPWSLNDVYLSRLSEPIRMQFIERFSGGVNRAIASELGLDASNIPVKVLSGTGKIEHLSELTRGTKSEFLESLARYEGFDKGPLHVNGFARNGEVFLSRHEGGFRFTTIVHEKLHVLSKPFAKELEDFAFGPKISQPLDEGLTEFFSEAVSGRVGLGRNADKIYVQARFVDLAEALSSRIGRKELADIFFGKENLLFNLENKVDAAAGRGTMQAVYAALNHNRIGDAITLLKNPHNTPEQLAAFMQDLKAADAKIVKSQEPVIRQQTLADGKRATSTFDEDLFKSLPPLKEGDRVTLLDPILGKKSEAKVNRIHFDESDRVLLLHMIFTDGHKKPIGSWWAADEVYLARLPEKVQAQYMQRFIRDASKAIESEFGVDASRIPVRTLSGTSNLKGLGKGFKSEFLDEYAKGVSPLSDGFVGGFHRDGDVFLHKHNGAYRFETVVHELLHGSSRRLITDAERLGSEASNALNEGLTMRFANRISQKVGASIHPEHLYIKKGYVELADALAKRVSDADLQKIYFGKEGMSLEDLARLVDASAGKGTMKAAVEAMNRGDAFGAAKIIREGVAPSNASKTVVTETVTAKGPMQRLGPDTGSPGDGWNGGRGSTGSSPGADPSKGSSGAGAAGGPSGNPERPTGGIFGGGSNVPRNNVRGVAGGASDSIFDTGKAKGPGPTVDAKPSNPYKDALRQFRSALPQREVAQKIKMTLTGGGKTSDLVKNALGDKVGGMVAKDLDEAAAAEEAVQGVLRFTGPGDKGLLRTAQGGLRAKVEDAIENFDTFKKAVVHTVTKPFVVVGEQIGKVFKGPIETLEHGWQRHFGTTSQHFDTILSEYRELTGGFSALQGRVRAVQQASDKLGALLKKNGQPAGELLDRADALGKEMHALDRLIDVAEQDLRRGNDLVKEGGVTRSDTILAGRDQTALLKSIRSRMDDLEGLLLDDAELSKMGRQLELGGVKDLKQVDAVRSAYGELRGLVAKTSERVGRLEGWTDALVQGGARTRLTEVADTVIAPFEEVASLASQLGKKVIGPFQSLWKGAVDQLGWKGARLEELVRWHPGRRAPFEEALGAHAQWGKQSGIFLRELADKRLKEGKLTTQEHADIIGELKRYEATQGKQLDLAKIGSKSTEHEFTTLAQRLGVLSPTGKLNRGAVERLWKMALRGEADPETLFALREIGELEAKGLLQAEKSIDELIGAATGDLSYQRLRSNVIDKLVTKGSKEETKLAGMFKSHFDALGGAKTKLGKTRQGLAKTVEGGFQNRVAGGLDKVKAPFSEVANGAQVLGGKLVQAKRALVEGVLSPFKTLRDDAFKEFGSTARLTEVAGGAIGEGGKVLRQGIETARNALKHENETVLRMVEKHPNGKTLARPLLDDQLKRQNKMDLVTKKLDDLERDVAEARKSGDVDRVARIYQERVGPLLDDLDELKKMPGLDVKDVMTKLGLAQGSRSEKLLHRAASRWESATNQLDQGTRALDDATEEVASAVKGGLRPKIERTIEKHLSSRDEKTDKLLEHYHDIHQETLAITRLFESSDDLMKQVIDKATTNHPAKAMFQETRIKNAQTMQRVDRLRKQLDAERAGLEKAAKNGTLTREGYFLARKRQGELMAEMRQALGELRAGTFDRSVIRPAGKWLGLDETKDARLLGGLIDGQDALAHKITGRSEWLSAIEKRAELGERGLRDEVDEAIDRVLTPIEKVTSAAENVVLALWRPFGGIKKGAIRHFGSDKRLSGWLVGRQAYMERLVQGTTNKVRKSLDEEVVQLYRDAKGKPDQKQRDALIGQYRAERLQSIQQVERQMEALKRAFDSKARESNALHAIGQLHETEIPLLTKKLDDLLTQIDELPSSSTYKTLFDPGMAKESKLGKQILSMHGAQKNNLQKLTKEVSKFAGEARKTVSGGARGKVVRGAWMVGGKIAEPFEEMAYHVGRFTSSVANLGRAVGGAVKAPFKGLHEGAVKQLGSDAVHKAALEAKSTKLAEITRTLDGIEKMQKEATDEVLSLIGKDLSAGDRIKIVRAISAHQMEPKRKIEGLRGLVQDLENNVSLKGQGDDALYELSRVYDEGLNAIKNQLADLKVELLRGPPDLRSIAGGFKKVDPGSRTETILSRIEKRLDQSSTEVGRTLKNVERLEKEIAQIEEGGLVSRIQAGLRHHFQTRQERSDELVRLNQHLDDMTDTVLSLPHRSRIEGSFAQVRAGLGSNVKLADEVSTRLTQFNRAFAELEDIRDSMMSLRLTDPSLSRIDVLKRGKELSDLYKRATVATKDLHKAMFGPLTGRQFNVPSDVLKVHDDFARALEPAANALEEATGAAVSFASGGLRPRVGRLGERIVQPFSAMKNAVTFPYRAIKKGLTDQFGSIERVDFEGAKWSQRYLERTRGKIVKADERFAREERKYQSRLDKASPQDRARYTQILDNIRNERTRLLQSRTSVDQAIRTLDTKLTDLTGLVEKRKALLAMADDATLVEKGFPKQAMEAAFEQARVLFGDADALPVMLKLTKPFLKTASGGDAVDTLAHALKLAGVADPIQYLSKAKMLPTIAKNDPITLLRSGARNLPGEEGLPLSRKPTAFELEEITNKHGAPVAVIEDEAGKGYRLFANGLEQPPPGKAPLANVVDPEVPPGKGKEPPSTGSVGDDPLGTGDGKGALALGPVKQPGGAWSRFRDGFASLFRHDKPEPLPPWNGPPKRIFDPGRGPFADYLESPLDPYLKLFDRPSKVPHELALPRMVSDDTMKLLRWRYPDQEFTLMFKRGKDGGGSYVLFSGKDRAKYYPTGKDWTVLTQARGAGDFNKSDLAFLLALKKAELPPRFTAIEFGEAGAVVKNVELGAGWGRHHYIKEYIAKYFIVRGAPIVGKQGKHPYMPY